MGRGFFRRFFEDYTEERLPGDDGKLHTRRVYRGWWYAPRLSRAQRVLRAALYLLLFGGGVALFMLGAMQPSGSNRAWYVALSTGLVLFSALIEVIPLLGCIFGKPRQTVYQYRSGSKTCVLWARITAGLMALTAVLTLLFFALSREAAAVDAALFFAGACACEAAVGLLESHVAYDRCHNPDA